MAAVPHDWQLGIADLDLIALDADDTLWHDERFFAELSGKVEQLLGHYAPGPQLAAQLLETERRNLAVFGYGVKGFGLSLIETAIQISDSAVTAREIDQILAWTRELMDHPIELLPGVTDTLDWLAEVDVRLAVITKGDLFNQESKLASSGLADRFDHVAIVSEKDPATYQRLFDRWGCQPQRCLMVGNSVPSDIAPVLAAGGHAVMVPSGHTWALDARPVPHGVPVLDRLDELVALLR